MKYVLRLVQSFRKAGELIWDSFQTLFSVYSRKVIWILERYIYELQKNNSLDIRCVRAIVYFLKVLKRFQSILFLNSSYKGRVWCKKALSSVVLLTAFCNVVSIFLYRKMRESNLKILTFNFNWSQSSHDHKTFNIHREKKLLFSSGRMEALFQSNRWRHMNRRRALYLSKSRKSR